MEPGRDQNLRRFTQTADRFQQKMNVSHNSPVSSRNNYFPTILNTAEMLSINMESTVHMHHNQSSRRQTLDTGNPAPNTATEKFFKNDEGHTSSYQETRVQSPIEARDLMTPSFMADISAAESPLDRSILRQHDESFRKKIQESKAYGKFLDQQRNRMNTNSELQVASDQSKLSLEKPNRFNGQQSALQTRNAQDWLQKTQGKPSTNFFMLPQVRKQSSNQKMSIKLEQHSNPSSAAIQPQISARRDTKAQVNDLNNRFKEVKRCLSTLLTQKNQNTIQLEPGQRQQVSATQMCQIECLGKCSPCTVKFFRDESQVTSEFDVFVSQDAQQPNAEDRDHHYQNPKRILVRDKGKSSRFNTQFIYLGIVAHDSNMLLQIEASFQNPRGSPKRQNSIMPRLNKLYTRGFDVWLKEQMQVQDPREIYAKYDKYKKFDSSQGRSENPLLTKARPFPREKLEKHKAFIKAYPKIRQKISGDVQDDRRRLATLRRVEQDRFKVIDTLSNQQKWDMVREKRIKIHAALALQNKISQRCRCLVFWAISHQVVKKIHSRFADVMQQRHDRMKQAFLVTLIKSKMRTKLRRLMPNTAARNHLLLTNTYNATTTLFNHVCTQRAHEHFRDFLRDTSFVNNFLEGIRETNCLLVRIQRGYRNHFKCLSDRQDALAKDLWDLNVAQLSNIFVKYKKKQPEYIELITRMNMISVEIKSRILQLYSARQNLLHAVRFLQYLIMKRSPPPVSPNLFACNTCWKEDEIHETVQTRLSQMLEIDYVLFGTFRLPALEVQTWKLESHMNLREAFAVEQGTAHTFDQESIRGKDLAYLEAISDKLFPIRTSDQFKTWTVPETTMKYRIHSGVTTPSFVFLPSDQQVVQRIIIRAVFTQNISELKMNLSSC